MDKPQQNRISMHRSLVARPTFKVAALRRAASSTPPQGNSSDKPKPTHDPNQFHHLLELLKSSIPGQQSKSTSTTPTARAPTASTTNTQRAPDPHLTALINSLSVMHASSVARKQARAEQGFHRRRSDSFKSNNHQQHQQQQQYQQKPRDFRSRMSMYRQQTSSQQYPLLAPTHASTRPKFQQNTSSLTLDDEVHANSSSNVVKKLKKIATLQATREVERRESTIGPKKIILTDQPLNAKTLAGMCSGGVTPDAVLKITQSLGETMIRDASVMMEADTAALVLMDLGYEAVILRDNGDDKLDARRRAVPADLSAWKPRAPVVCVMGHVNHGKTTLLDYMRKTSVAAKEVGGITQSIGAFTVETGPNESLCVMDTPGHAAFRHMRALGAHLTDIVVLVVSADDSIMPQTLEAIRLIQHANVPLVVAVNKCDMFMHNFKQVKQDLLKEGITDEADGGDTFIVPMSAKTGLNVPQLLEAIQFTAQMMDLRADSEGAAEAMVVEARVDRGLGALANVIVDRGTLHVGDAVVCGTHHGRIRKLIDSRGREVTEAGPSTPVSIVGLDGAPEAGSELLCVESLEKAQKVVSYRIENARKQLLARDTMSERKASVARRAAAEDQARRDAESARPASAQQAAQDVLNQQSGSDNPETVAEAAQAAFIDHTIEDMQRQAATQTQQQGELSEAQRYEKMSGSARRKATRQRRAEAKLALEAEEASRSAEAKARPTAVLVVKADNHGSLKTLLDFISMIPDDEVLVKVVKTGVGEITESDVQHASEFEATIFGFNVEASDKVRATAKHDGVALRVQALVYSIFDDLREHVSSFLPPIIKYEPAGSLEVAQVYTLHSSKKSKNISAAAGCRVTHGQIDLAVGRRFRVVRGGESVFEGELVSLKHLKDEVQLMKKGGECGLTLEGFGAYERGDTVQQLIEKRSRRLVNMPVYDVASFDLDKLQFGSSGFGQKRNSTQEAQKSL